jgi:hypothetical protein
MDPTEARGASGRSRSCKHRSGHDGVEASTAAPGVTPQRSRRPSAWLQSSGDGSPRWRVRRSSRPRPSRTRIAEDPVAPAAVSRATLLCGGDRAGAAVERLCYRVLRFPGAVERGWASASTARPRSVGRAILSECLRRRSLINSSTRLRSRALSAKVPHSCWAARRGAAAVLAVLAVRAAT